MTATHPRSAADDVAAAMRIASRELGAQHARLYLFGSRARGSAARASDIDIAILPDAPLEPGTLARIREALEESTIPYEVEVIDLSSVDESFRRKVLAEAIAWNG
jgi:predicted nucleotidyltransferase